MKRIALIVAGGEGKRMHSVTPKQFLIINNLPVLIHTLKKFSHLDQIILVLPKKLFASWKKLCEKYNFTQKHTLISGGSSRFKSVQNGLLHVKEKSIIAIHDGVRPLISKKLINKMLSSTKKGEGVIPVLPMKNSVRKINSQGSFSINRSLLYTVQTPQCFFSSDIKNAYTGKIPKTFTDDASVFEYSGGRIITVSGEEKNIKITTKEDLKIAELLN